MKQMSIQSIKIKIGNETKELTIKEAKALKDALDELFPQRMPQWLPPAHIETRPLPIPQWIPPNPHVDPLKPYCTTSLPPNLGESIHRSDLNPLKGTTTYP
jgi:hypothetical protein